MAIFIKLGVLFVVLVASLIVITQIIIPSFKGQETWPATRRKKKVKSLEEIKDQIDDVEAGLHLHQHKVELHEKQRQLAELERELADREEESETTDEQEETNQNPDVDERI